ncbi:hypothetical protein [Nocardia flavorosea]|uniref:Uncharacterized protein n=1 Tax=Nocardia flavorosea TaxID=53429 RepID=A0A846YTI1_9NOCA|nr:hypothetical protein [Nocardia flavorosea]NKY60784.1 hypothetical protein [Nocardia flavorosea]
MDEIDAFFAEFDAEPTIEDIVWETAFHPIITQVMRNTREHELRMAQEANARGPMSRRDKRRGPRTFRAENARVTYHRP